MCIRDRLEADDFYDIQAFTKTDKKGFLVLFYKESCSIYGKYYPEFATAAENSTSPTIQFAKFNCEDEPEVVKSFGIQYYPTILLFISGNVYELKGNRGFSKVLAFITEDYKTSASITFPENFTSGDTLEENWLIVAILGSSIIAIVLVAYLVVYMLSLIHI
eukprot:TRINITY_DN6971_c0_g1_i1.p2 TRINITY_DN6971_c0_g1~~TRINITY_DN6971_c0_g1_i1.p2  ORF type:complete len:162 (+),score=28.65 TRINITY_DN6971_c0_g1_i1:65-550(+)